MLRIYLLITLIMCSSLMAEDPPHQENMTKGPREVPRRRIQIINDHTQQELAQQKRTPGDACLCYLFWRFMCCSEEVATETPFAVLPKNQ